MDNEKTKARPLPNLTARNIKNFWRKVSPERDGDRCRAWLGSTTEAGYGEMRLVSKKPTYLAHRISYFLAHGECPANLDVLHRCDNPLCVNPAHLFLGTQADNNKDRNAKGRAPNLRGIKNSCAKLTEADVREIRQAFRDGTVTQRDSAARYGVNQKTIWQVRHHIKWAHVA